MNMGFNANARVYMEDSANGEGMTLESLLEYEDSSDFEALFDSLRKPGGTIPNPNAAVQGQPQALPNPGVRVSSRAIDNFKTGCFIAQHMQKCGRTAEANVYTTNRLRQWKALRKQAEDYVDPDELPKLQKETETAITDFIDEFDGILSSFTGTGGRPLNYIIRDNDAVPPQADQPMYTFANSPFTSVRHELLERSALNGAHYDADSERVFEILKNAVFDFKRVYLQIRSFARAKDGRAAFDAFQNHYLGAAALEQIVAKAENRIAQSVYSGDKPRYTFETHVTVHQRAHMDIERGGEAMWDGNQKVRRFLATITAREMEVPIATVKAIANLRTDWDACINYLRNFVRPLGSTGRKVAAIEYHSESTSPVEQAAREISRLMVDKMDKKSSKKGPDASKIEIADRYYKPDEWKALVKAGKHERILELRKKRPGFDNSTGRRIRDPKKMKTEK